MQISPINSVQYKNKPPQNVAFNGFFRTLKNIAGSAIETGVNIANGKTIEPVGEFFDQLSLRETGYRVGEKEKIARRIAEQEKELAKEEENARKAKEIIEEKRLDSLAQKYKDILKDEFLSVVELAQKDSNIVPPNGILIETPRKFKLKDEFEYPCYFIKQQRSFFSYFIKNNLTLEQLQNFMYEHEERENQWFKQKGEYFSEKEAYEDKVGIQERVLSYLKNKENINQYEIESNDLAQMKTTLQFVQEKYKEDGKHSLVWLNSFESLGSVEDNNKKTVAILKNIMCSCAEKFHVTFLLKMSEDSISKIDPILLVDSRIPIKIKI